MRAAIPWGLAGAGCLASVVCIGAASADGNPTCTAKARGADAIPAEHIANESVLVERSNRARDAAKATLDAATAARDAIVQRLQQQPDAGADDGGLADMARASAAVKDALAAWNAADVRAKCAANELDFASAAFARDRLYGWALEPTLSVAGGAGGASRYGGGALVSMRDTIFFSEVQLGFEAYKLAPPAAPLGAKNPATLASVMTYQVPIRTYFGDSDVGLYLGAAPAFYSRSGSTTAALVPQGGLRLRGVTEGPWLFFADLKLFAEPWIFFDGTPTIVLFGAEIGLGAAPKIAPVESIEWTYSLDTASVPEN